MKRYKKHKAKDGLINSPKNLKEVEVKGISPRQQAYNDSLKLYNQYQTGLNYDRKFDFVKEGPEISEEELKNQLLHNFGTLNPEGSRGASGRIESGDYSFHHWAAPKNDPQWKKGEEQMSGYWQHQETLNKTLERNRIKPSGYIPQLLYDEKYNPNKPEMGGYDYVAVYKKPVYNPSSGSVNPIQPQVYQSVNTQPLIKPMQAPNGFTQPHPNYPQLRIQYSQSGKALWILNNNGDRIPYDEFTKPTREFAFPKKIQR